ncbi:MAG: tyrosine-type recombinase/integrase [Solirubrobacteraceae bacterium]
MILFAAATGLRPGEWIALEHRDIDLDNRLVHVHRAFRVNRLKATKTNAARAVPLERSALDAPDSAPTSSRATWAPASSTSTAPTATSPGTPTSMPSSCSTATTAAAATWTLVDVPWTSTPHSRRPTPRRRLPDSSGFAESPLPDSNRRPLPYHHRRDD